MSIFEMATQVIVIYFSHLLGAPVEIENLILFDGFFMTRLPNKKCQTNNFGKNRPVGCWIHISFLVQFSWSIFKIILRKNLFWIFIDLKKWGKILASLQAFLATLWNARIKMHPLRQLQDMPNILENWTHWAIWVRILHKYVNVGWVAESPSQG